MARKLPSLQRIVGRQAIVSIVYGELSSSLYFSLGVVALWALGLTPLVLIGAGLLFALAAAAYAEGAAMNEQGAAAVIARRAFGDLVGFIVGWAVLLDFIVVIALSLLFVPHYAYAAIGRLGELHHPADELIAIVIAIAIGAVRVLRRATLYRTSWIVAIIDLGVQLGLALLGLALVFDPTKLTQNLDAGSSPTWTALAYSVPLATVAFAGIEIVANLIREAKHPAHALARDTIWAVAGTTLIYVVISVVALSAFPVQAEPGAPSGYASALSTTWLNAPLAGVAQQVGNEISTSIGDVFRVLVAVSAILVLLFNATTAFSGGTRLLRGLARTSCVPAMFGQTKRRSLTSPAAIALIVAGVVAILPVASLVGGEATGLVSIYAFGILIAFMAVFLAVVWLRVTEPEARRPIRMRGNVRFGRGVSIPVFALVGFALAWLCWLLALGTHRAARIVPPAWLALGIVVYVVTRKLQGLPLRAAHQEVPVPPPEVAEVPYGVIVVPMKQAGPIEEEMLATACKLAQADGARVLALKAIEVPLALPLDTELPDEDARAAHAMELAASFGPDYGVDVECRIVRGRAISGVIAAEARRVEAGLILIGAVPHKGAQAGRAHVFSETVENLLRRADSRVIVTAFPPGTASVAEPAPPAAEPAEHAPARG
jgi:APA family basic amino acid/polyamine antiporter